jgi:excinuclease ABC subunit C
VDSEAKNTDATAAADEREDRLRAKVAALPAKPGVYLMKNEKGKVIYVGKAARLSHRVRNYFGKFDSLDAKTQTLVRHIHDFDYVVVPKEKDALLMESQLVHEYRPRYNVRLKDDKRFPYLRLRSSEAFPRIDIVRQPGDDGDEYFGPYTDAKAMRLTLKTLTSIFPIRTCELNLPKEKVPRPCLDYYIHRCGAPCVGYVDRESYAELVEQVRLFLQGRSGVLLEELRDRMREHAQRLRFEDAGRMRDTIEAVQKVVAHQEKVLPEGQDADVFALDRDGKDACGVVLHIRDGKLLQSETYFLGAVLQEEEDVYFARFLAEHAGRTLGFAAEILFDRELPDQADWLELFGERSGRSVRIRVPKRGERGRLVEMARMNANFKLREHRAKAGLRTAVRADEDPSIADLKERLKLPVAPHSMECFDMSHFQGSQRVGALVYFSAAKPLKSRYRRFKIQRVEGIDDLAMMQECLERYYSKLRDEDQLPADLVVVDGGASQLGIAVKTLQRYGFVETAVIGLAKREEEIYTPHHSEPVRLPRTSPGLRLLQRLRDEAHRFAIGYHRQLRSKEAHKSVLDEIPGVGAVKRRILLEHFGAPERIARASVEEIASLDGIGAKDAERIVEFFLRRNESP